MIYGGKDPVQPFINVLNDSEKLASLSTEQDQNVAFKGIEDYINAGNRSEKEKLISILKQVWQAKKDTGSGSVMKVFTNMGEFFKSSAWTYQDEDKEVTGWKPNKISIIGSILYAMFIAQSIMFFFAYMKRFFYITMLALFAPLVIIYDFLVKSIK